jgi:hypothetical protein
LIPETSLVESAQDKRMKRGFSLAAEVVRGIQKLNVAFRLEATDHTERCSMISLRMVSVRAVL